MVSAYYILTSLSYLAIVAVSLYAYAAWRREKIQDSLSNCFGIFGSLFALPALMNLIWAFSILEPTAEDALLINGSFYVVASVISLITIYNITGNKHLLYLLAMFGATFLSLSYSFSNFFISLMVVSSLLFLIISLDALIVKRYHIQFVGIVGSAYSILSLVFTLLLYSGVSFVNLWWFLPNLLLAAFIFLLHLDKKYYALINPGLFTRQKPHIKKMVFGLNFIRYTLYVGSVVAFTFIATVSVHELGHAATAYYYGCDHAEIRYDLQTPPFTEIRCPSAAGTPLFIITIMGLVFVLASSLIFYFTEGQFTTRLAHLMAGFGLLTFYNDFLDLGASKSMATLLVMVSVLVIIDAVVRFSLFYINEHSNAARYSLPEGSVSHPLKKLGTMPEHNTNENQ